MITGSDNGQMLLHLYENLIKLLHKTYFSSYCYFVLTIKGINYYADLRMTFRQNFFLQDWFRNKFGVGLG
jgi:hypothetical protein